MARHALFALAPLVLAALGCGDPIEGEWVYRDEPDDLLLEASFVASPEREGEGDVLYDIPHVPNVEMAVAWSTLEDGRYRLDFKCLDVPDRQDLSCDSLSFWLACSLRDDTLECDFADCSECGKFTFDRVP